MICQKCGSENQEGKKFCGECGTKLNKGNITSGTINKKIIILSIVALLILLGSVFGVYSYNKYQDQKKAELKKIQEIKYEATLKNVITEISNQTSEIDYLTKGYSDITKRIIEANEHHGVFPIEVIINGQKVYDVNTGIKLRREGLESDGVIKKITTAKSSIQSKMRLLDQPSERYKEAYNMIFELYKYYAEYETMVESPEGSAISYDQKAKDLHSKIIKKLDELQAKIPSKK